MEMKMIQPAVQRATLRSGGISASGTRASTTYLPFIRVFRAAELVRLLVKYSSEIDLKTFDTFWYDCEWDNRARTREMPEYAKMREHTVTRWVGGVQGRTRKT